MLDSASFLNRLEYILEYYNINASAFADKIDVQRSAISHIMSGRNKPSLEFILKIADNYPEINIEWLLGRKNSFLYTENILGTTNTDIPVTGGKETGNVDLFKGNITDEKSEERTTPPSVTKFGNEISDKSSKDENKSKETAIDNFGPYINQDVKNGADSKSIAVERIVIFYNNGTFKEYIPS